MSCTKAVVALVKIYFLLEKFLWASRIPAICLRRGRHSANPEDYLYSSTRNYWGLEALIDVNLVEPMLKGGAWFVNGELKAARHIGFVGDNTNKGAGHRIF
jgi:hypothetical protein